MSDRLHVLLVVMGLIVIFLAFRDQRAVRSGPITLKRRLKNFQFSLLLVLLACAPLALVLLRIFDDEKALAILAGIGIPIAVAGFVVACVIGFLEGWGK